MSKETPKWTDHIRLDERVMIEFEKMPFRKKSETVKGTVYNIFRYGVEILDEGRSEFAKMITRPTIMVPYSCIMRMKNFDTDYDSGELDE